jgi:hypothetical protein
MRVVNDPVVGLVAIATLVLVFAAASASKIRAWEDFVGVVQNYRILPDVLSRPVAYALPLVEGAVALGLGIGPARPYAAMVAIALLGVFSVAVGVNLARGRRYIDCGCFRFGMRQSLSWWLPARNAALVVVALVAARADLTSRLLTWLDTVTVTGGAAALFLLHVAATSVLAQPPEVDTAATGGAAR